ncbi:MAG: MerR family transcriptional regulator [Polyangia bacterium]
MKPEPPTTSRARGKARAERTGPAKKTSRAASVKKTERARPDKRRGRDAGPRPQPLDPRSNSQPGAPSSQSQPPEPSEWTISEVALRTGTPIATIKFYIREGLLPRPRTAGRTVGRYDAAFVSRLELVRELRSRFRLSLREIADLLAEAGPGATLTEIELRLRARERLDGAIDPAFAEPPVPHDRLIERASLVPADVADLTRLGLLTPIKVDGAVVYAERDARIAEVVGALRSSGYNERLGFKIANLLRYVEALRALVVREVEQFDNPALRGLPRDEVLRLIGQGVAHVDVLLGLLHKKLLLAAVHDRLEAASKRRAPRSGPRDP